MNNIPTAIKVNGKLDAVAYAKLYTRAGLRVFPFNPRTKGKGSPEGWPRINIPLEDVPKLFKDRNVGIACNKGNIVVIDCDTESARRAADRILPATLKGGHGETTDLHYFYRTDTEISKVETIANVDDSAVVELLAGDKNCVMPPSIHEDGDMYNFEDEIDHTDPEAFLESIFEIETDVLMSRSRQVGLTAIIYENMPPIGARHKYAMALSGLLLKAGYPLAGVRAVLITAWRLLPSAERSNKTIAEVEGAITDTENSLKNGEKVIGGGVLNKMCEGLAPTLCEAAGLDSDAWKAAGDGTPTPKELVEMVAEKYPNKLAYRSSGTWALYEGGVWETVHDASVDGLVKSVVLDEVPTASIGHVRGIRDLYRPDVVKRDTEFDTYGDMLVMKNGVLNVLTGEISPHDPNLYATARVEYDYDPDATCPMTMYALASLNDRLGYDAASFLQEYAGYSLMSYIGAQKTLWLIGKPGGGKSTIIKIFRTLHGPLAGSLSPTDVMRQFGLAAIEGKRLVVATEISEKTLHNTPLLNQLVDGGEIGIEHKGRDKYEIYNGAKIIWAMNDEPQVISPNDDIYRRAVLLEVPELAEEDQKAEVLEGIPNEGPGILNWALEGLRRYVARGMKFDIPPQMIQRTAKWKNDNDTVRTFIDAWFDLDSSKPAKNNVSRTSLYILYKLWYAWEDRNPRFKLGRNTFNKAVENRVGLKCSKTTDGDRVWESLTLSEDGESDIEEIIAGAGSQMKYEFQTWLDEEGFTSERGRNRPDYAPSSW